MVCPPPREPSHGARVRVHDPPRARAPRGREHGLVAAQARDVRPGALPGPGQPVRALPGAGAGDPRAAHRALARDRAPLPRDEHPPRLLPLHGVPHGAHAPERHPRARGRGALPAHREGPGLHARRPRGPGGRGRARLGRPRAPRGLLRRLGRDPRAAGVGLRAALPVRPLPPAHPAGLAERGARPLARPREPVGGVPRRRRRHGQLLRRRDRLAGPDGSAPLPLARDRGGPGHPLRRAGAGLRDHDLQHPPAVGHLVAEERARPARLPAGRLRRRLPEEAARRADHGRALPGRAQRRRQGAAPAAAVRPRLGHAPGPAPPPREDRRRRAHLPRGGRPPAQRHAPDARDPRAHAAAHRPARARVGRGLVDHPADLRLHEPHPHARGPRALAAPHPGPAPPAPRAAHRRDRPALPRAGPAPVPGRRAARGPHGDHRPGARPAGAHGEPGLRRELLDQRRGGAPHGPAQERAPGRRARHVPGAHQQQDERDHPAALAEPGEPRPGRPGHEQARARLDPRPGRAARDRALRGRPRVPRPLARGEAREQALPRRAGEEAPEHRPRPDGHVRRADQAHARVQAAAPPRAPGHPRLPGPVPRPGRARSPRGP
jgi:hypothetical protein